MLFGGISLSDSFQKTFDNLGDFIPKLVGAIVIFFIGVFFRTSWNIVRTSRWLLTFGASWYVSRSPGIFYCSIGIFHDRFGLIDFSLVGYFIGVLATWNIIRLAARSFGGFAPIEVLRE